MKEYMKHSSTTGVLSHTQSPVIPCRFLVFEVNTFEQHLQEKTQRSTGTVGRPNTLQYQATAFPVTPGCLQCSTMCPGHAKGTAAMRTQAIKGDPRGSKGTCCWVSSAASSPPAPQPFLLSLGGLFSQGDTTDNHPCHKPQFELSPQQCIQFFLPGCSMPQAINSSDKWISTKPSI